VPGEVKPVAPGAVPSPAGPLTPGVDAGGYLYVSAQGPRAPNGERAAGVGRDFAQEVAQVLDNVKTVVEAAGLTMEHVVYTHVYPRPAARGAARPRAGGRRAPAPPPPPPPRAGGGGGAAGPPPPPVAIEAVAVHDLSSRQCVRVAGRAPVEPACPGVLTSDRL